MDERIKTEETNDLDTILEMVSDVKGDTETVKRIYKIFNRYKLAISAKKDDSVTLGPFVTLFYKFPSEKNGILAFVESDRIIRGIDTIYHEEGVGLPSKGNNLYFDAIKILFEKSLDPDFLSLVENFNEKKGSVAERKDLNVIKRIYGL